MSKDVRQWKSARRACQTSFSAHMQAHDGVPISTKCQLFVRQRLQGGHEFHLTIMLIVYYCSPCTSALSPPTNIQCGDSQVPWTMRSHASTLACTLVWAQGKGVDSIDSGWLNIDNLADGSFSQTRWTSHVVRILCADGCLGIIGHDYTFGSYGQWSISYISYHVRTAVVCTAIAPYPATMTQPRMTSDKVLATLTFDTASGRPPLHFLLSNDGKTVISVGRAPKSDAQLQSVR